MKTQQKFKNEMHNVLTEEINKIALNSNDDKRIQWIDPIEAYAYRTSKDLVCNKDKNNIIKLLKWLALMML